MFHEMVSGLGEKTITEKEQKENDIAVLFVKARSYYKKIPGLDCYDIKRDALNYDGKMPAICHPPCRAWCRLSHMAKPRPGERELAPWSIELVNELGGIVEQPAWSKLWDYMGLPKPSRKQWITRGDVTVLEVNQIWFGHQMKKPTWLYFSKCEPRELPFDLRSKQKEKWITDICKEQAMHTPPKFAHYLVDCIRERK